jgi:hypothetical protein
MGYNLPIDPRDIGVNRDKGKMGPYLYKVIKIGAKSKEFL